MTIRPATPEDLDAIQEIDSVIESSNYLHIERSGEGAAIQFKLEQRPLREKLIEPNRFTDDTQFVLKQIITGGDEGTALIAEHDGQVVGVLLAQPRAEGELTEILDLRVDFDYRRQGLATVLLYSIVDIAKKQEHRAVSITIRTNNTPAADLLTKLGFELSGLDIRRHSNHDLVKEAVSLVWYYEIT